jgi:glycosyltransferase involved in cell wall biosynthesis
MVLPSLRECGGTVILEAMAMGLPVIATRWGGPANYVDDSMGIRVAPDTRESFIGGLAEAMIELAESPQLRRQMSEAARRRAGTNYYDWDSKADRMLEIFRQTLQERATATAADRTSAR